MTLNEALDRVKVFAGGACVWRSVSHPSVEATAAHVGLGLSREPGSQAWTLDVCAERVDLSAYFTAIDLRDAGLLVVADLSVCDAWTRDTFDRAAIGAGFRRFPGILSLVGFEEIERESGWIILAYQRVDPAVERRFPFGFLSANRDLHMDMTREAGRRSDAHLARYHFARTRLSGCMRTLDAACGLGYGAEILAQDDPNRSVVGIDIDSSSVEYARATFGKNLRVSYETCDVADLSMFSDSVFDAVISFETIEHLEDPSRFLTGVHRVLREGGLFIASVPYNWVTDDCSFGPYHHDWFDAKKLLGLCSRYLTVDEVWVQTAGGGHFCRDAARGWRRLSVLGEEPAAPAEWLVLVGRKRCLLPRRAEASWVFLAPGLPQLATMFAAARHWSVPPGGVTVFGSSSFSDSFFDEAMSQMASEHGAHYGGNLFVSPDVRIAGDPFDFCPDDSSGRAECGARIRSSCPVLESLRGCRLAMTTRPNMPGDYALLAAIEPIETRLVADGIQNETPVRSWSGSRGFTRNELVEFPTEAEIWCPPWLEPDTKSIGRARVLDSSECLEELVRVASLKAATSLSAALRARGGFSCVIISQHFSRSGLCSSEVEHVFYLHQIRHLLSQVSGLVLFKAHPRDPAEKLAALARAIGSDAARVYFTSGTESHVPLEAMMHAFPNANLTVFGTSSSALLGVRSWPRCIVSCIDADYLDIDVRRQVVRFAKEHGLDRRLLRFDDLLLDDTDRRVLRRRIVANRNELLASMDTKIRSQLQQQLAAIRTENTRLKEEAAYFSRELSAARRNALQQCIEMIRARTGSSPHVRPVYIWGAGSGGRRVLAVLRAARLEPTAFVDGDETKAGRELGGVLIQHYSSMQRGTGTPPFVVIASTHAPAIVGQLEAAGMLSSRDFVAMDFAEIEAWEHAQESSGP